MLNILKNQALTDVAMSFKKTDKKNNVMREARDLFYVKILLTY